MIWRMSISCPKAWILVQAMRMLGNVAKFGFTPTNYSFLKVPKDCWKFDFVYNLQCVHSMSPLFFKTFYQIFHIILHIMWSWYSMGTTFIWGILSNSLCSLLILLNSLYMSIRAFKMIIFDKYFGTFFKLLWMSIHMIKSL